MIRQSTFSFYLIYFSSFRLAPGKSAEYFQIFLAIFQKHAKLLKSKIKRGRALVARQAHNLEAEGSIPSPATKNPRTYISVSPFILPRFREVTQTENSISTVKSVVVKILENTHFPHFAYIFCKQNVSKIPCSTVTIPQLLVKVKSAMSLTSYQYSTPLLYPCDYGRDDFV